MATNFNLSAHEIIRQATQKVKGGKLNGEELKTYLLYLNLLLKDLINQGYPLSSMIYWEEELFSGTNEYELDNQVLDIFSATSQKSSSTEAEIPMRRYGMKQFNEISKKSQVGRPVVYMVERNHDFCNLKVWPAPNQGYTLRMYVFTRPNDILKYTDTIDIRPEYLPAIIAGLAYEIGMDRQIDPVQLEMLKENYQEKLSNVYTEDRERVSFRVTPSYDKYS